MFLCWGCVVVPKQPSPPESPTQTTNQFVADGVSQANTSPVTSNTLTEPIGLAGTLQVDVGACTKKGCSQDAPCCNTCQSSLALLVDASDARPDMVGKTVALRNHGCVANECGQLPNCNMSHGQQVEFTNINEVSCNEGSQGGQCVALLASELKDGGTQIDSQSVSPTGGVSLYGKIMSNSTCTLVGCPEDKPCCNACTPMIAIKPLSGAHRSKTILLEGHGCKADGCGKLTDCELKGDAIVTLPNVVVTCEDGETCTGVVK